MSSSAFTSSPSQPQNQAKKKMHPTDNQHAVVRLLPSTGLEGAFRVHFTPESLREAGLKIGDLCEISCDDGATGYAIAWQAADSIGNRPKTRPAKMTETFKTAFGFQDGSRVTVSRTDSKVYPAMRMVLSDVTPPEYSTSDDMDAGMWEINMKYLFGKCEVLAPGISFDVQGHKKSRKRFFIESIESREAPVDSPSLFVFKSSTEIMFPEGIAVQNQTNNTQSNGSTSTSNNTANGTTINGMVGNGLQSPSYHLNIEHIGGLLEQIQMLNRHLRRVLDTAQTLNQKTGSINTILLHGYEGTGKTMLLKRLGQAPFRKVVRIERATLPGSTLAANKKFIKESFEEAVNEQPALVLMDNLDQLAPTDETAYSGVIEAELEKVRKPGSRVMVVAAARNPSDIHASLKGPQQFCKQIELPIPNLEAREQILNVLQGKPAFAKDTLSTAIAEQTHGYTARDVNLLDVVAKDHACDRYEDECAEHAMGRSSTPPAYEDIVPRLDGSRSPSKTDSQPNPEVTLQDFEKALQEIKPTALREIFTEKPKTKWTDIGGSETVKQSFDEIIEMPLRHKDIMARHGVQPAKGVLLYGPPGCSKTLTAQAVANTYKLNFIAIKGAELISMYVGESERAVREVFRKARQAAPCVIFFDEIDSIGTDRDTAGTKGLNVLTTLLNEMDGFEALKDVFVLAATNKPWSLDSALMRPGRFDKHVYLGPPNEAARRDIIALTTRSSTLAKDVDFDVLAKDLEGWSGAEIVRICQNAKMPAFVKALRGEGEHRVCKEDFEVARKGVKKGITREMLEMYEAFSQQQEVS